MEMLVSKATRTPMKERILENFAEKGFQVVWLFMANERESKIERERERSKILELTVYTSWWRSNKTKGMSC